MSARKHLAIHETDALADLDAAVGELINRDHLYARLRDLIPQQTTILESKIGSHTRYSAAPIPWNTPAAMLYLDIHAAAREHETNLTLLLWEKATYRGPADALTTQAITRLPTLIRAAHDADHSHRTIVTEATHDLTTWPVLIRRILDESRTGENPWTKAPGNLHCPDGHTLYLAPGWQYDVEHADAICRHCNTPDGQHPRWNASAWLGKLQAQTDTQTDATAEKLRDPDRAVTATQAATIWGLSTDQVYVWEHRGRITPTGTDSDGRKTYLNAHITQLLVGRVAE